MIEAARITRLAYIHWIYYYLETLLVRLCIALILWAWFWNCQCKFCIILRKSKVARILLYIAQLSEIVKFLVLLWNKYLFILILRSAQLNDVVIFSHRPWTWWLEGFEKPYCACSPISWGQSWGCWGRWGGSYPLTCTGSCHGPCRHASRNGSEESGIKITFL